LDYWKIKDYEILQGGTDFRKISENWKWIHKRYTALIKGYCIDRGRFADWGYLEAVFIVRIVF